MYIKEVREVIRDAYGEDVIFLGADGGADCYDKSIAGVTDEGRLIYDADSIIQELMEDNNWEIEDAVDWYDYNIVRAIPYAGENGPILMNSACVLYDDAKWLKEQRDKEND